MMNSTKKYRMMLFFVMIGICCMSLPYPVQASDDAVPPEEQEHLYEGFLYFAGPGSAYLKSVQQIFAAGLKGHELGKAILQALIKGPSVPGLEPVIPGTAAVRALFITDDATAYVDLDIPEDITMSMDVQSEMLMVFAVVNSLTVNIPEIDKVKILIQGKEARTLAGHIDLGCFYQTNMLIVK